MTSQIIDSDRRCVRCSKLMVLEIGQGEQREVRAELVHQCWSCGYHEKDSAWRRPKVKVGPTMAERLKAQRLGEAVPWRDFVYPDEVPT